GSQLDVRPPKGGGVGGARAGAEGGAPLPIELEALLVASLLQRPVAGGKQTLGFELAQMLLPGRRESTLALQGSGNLQRFVPLALPEQEAGARDGAAALRPRRQHHPPDQGEDEHLDEEADQEAGMNGQKDELTGQRSHRSVVRVFRW